MSERPILFSAAMVRALLAGTKTQTRRIVDYRRLPHAAHCPYGVVGSRLWVKETWGAHAAWDHHKPTDIPSGASVRIYYAASEEIHGRTRPSIFMRRWMSRLTLEVTKVRVQRLQDISEEDARAEGVEARDGALPKNPGRWRGSWAKPP
jgi:hypothetical protein